MYFFFNDTATTEIYTLSLHDALPILGHVLRRVGLLDPAEVVVERAVLHHHHDEVVDREVARAGQARRARGDRKSTRLNSSHANISYAVFCLKKKTTTSLRSWPPAFPP